MIQDFLLSFKDNIKQKTTNPFFGTLIIVWSIHNWELLYSLFNFKESITLDNRIIYIRQFLSSIPFLENLGLCIFITIIVLIITYFLLNLSRLIVNFYEKKITPYIFKITDSSSIVLKSEYEKLEKKIEVLDAKFNKERDLRLQIQDEREKLESRVGELLTSEKESKTLSEKSISSERLKSVYETIKTNNFIDELGKAIESIGNSFPLKNSESGVRFFGKIGVITKVDKQVAVGYTVYKFTELGEKIRDLYLDENILNKTVS